MGKLRKMAAMASAAAVLAVGLPVGTANAVAGPPFSDVDANTPHSNDIYWMFDSGISTGWPVGNGQNVYRGMSKVVRQDMAAFLRREAKRAKVEGADTWKPSATDWKRFKDVNKSTPHAEDIL